MTADSERLARHAGQDLEWVPTAWWRSAWELRAGESPLLRLEAASWWRKALAASLDGREVVFGRSLWHDTAVRVGDDVELARLHRTRWRRDEDSERLGMSAWWGVGRLEFAGGEPAWLKRAPWSSRWTLLDARDRELATFGIRYAGLRSLGTMRLARLAAERPSLALLATFAWWVITRERARRSRTHGGH